MSLGGEKFETESTLILDIIVKIHLVLWQCVTVLVSLGADISFKIFALPMELLVLQEILKTCEWLVTFRAGEGPMSRVGTKMNLQRVSRGQIKITLAALERCIFASIATQVHSGPVRLQFFLRGQLFETNTTLKLLRDNVRFYWHFLLIVQFVVVSGDLDNCICNS
jgi:hypothetical protein